MSVDSNSSSGTKLESGNMLIQLDDFLTDYLEISSYIEYL